MTNAATNNPSGNSVLRPPFWAGAGVAVATGEGTMTAAGGTVSDAEVGEGVGDGAGVMVAAGIGVGAAGALPRTTHGESWSVARNGSRSAVMSSRQPAG